METVCKDKIFTKTKCYISLYLYIIFISKESPKHSQKCFEACPILKHSTVFIENSYIEMLDVCSVQNTAKYPNYQPDRYNGVTVFAKEYIPRKTVVAKAFVASNVD